MQVILCIVSVIYGGLSIIAASFQIKNEKKPIPPAILMIGGSLLLMSGAVFNVFGQWYDYIIAMIGCIMISASAVWNGIKSKQFHVQHHIIRAIVTILLITGYIVL